MKQVVKFLIAFGFAFSTACAHAQSFGPVPQVSISTNIPTYASADTNIANTGAGDIFCIANTSATKNIYVTEYHANATATAAIVGTVSLIKRSTLDTGGTPVTETVVPLVSNNPVTIASVTGYTVSPTAGTAIGTIAGQKIAIGVQGNTANVTDAQFFWGNTADQALRIGNGHSLCINVSAAGAGASWAVYVKWTEQ